MNDILNLEIDLEKSVLELKTQKFKKRIPVSGIKTREENGSQIVEFVIYGKPYVIIADNGEVIDCFWQE